MFIVCERSVIVVTGWGSLQESLNVGLFWALGAQLDLDKPTPLPSGWVLGHQFHPPRPLFFFFFLISPGMALALALALARWDGWATCNQGHMCVHHAFEHYNTIDFFSSLPFSPIILIFKLSPIYTKQPIATFA